MKNIYFICILLFVFVHFAFPQIYNTPLTMQGLNNVKLPSANSRAMGGVTLTITDDVSLMFANPAFLQSLKSIQLSISNSQTFKSTEQTQQWYPLLYYSNFSLLMEGISRGIKDPDTIRNFPPTAGDSVQRPFDDIEPNWKYSKNKNIPIQASIGIPFSVGGIKFGVGLGFIQYADLDYYYSNSNVLSPDFGSFRSGVYTLPPTNRVEDSKVFYWYQTIRKRIGNLYGYGATLSSAISENVSIGVSVLNITGKSDDFESIVSRGELRMFRDYFGCYKVKQDTILSGKSEFNGYEYNFSTLYKNENFILAISIKPPATIERNYKGTIRVDTFNVAKSNVEFKTKDEMVLPWRGAIGLSIALRKNFKISTELHLTPYSSATYLKNDGTWTKPWLDGTSFRVGIEYLPISDIAIRGGFFTQSEVFEAEGNYNPGTPVTSSGYTCGIGYRFYNFRFNVSYEYLNIKCEDKWATNVNKNTDLRENLIFNVAYVLPW